MGLILIETISEATRFPIKRKIRINAPKIWQTRLSGNIGGWVMLTIKFKKKKKERKEKISARFKQ